MICYLDRTFCSRPLNECTCSEYRRFTKEMQEGAKKWWSGLEGDPPVCFAVMCEGKSHDTIDN